MKKVIFHLVWISLFLSSISLGARPTIDITSPRGGDTVYFEDYVLVKWKTTGDISDGTVYLSFSLDSGRNWSPGGKFQNQDSGKWYHSERINNCSTVRLKVQLELHSNTKSRAFVAEDKLVRDFKVERKLLPDLTITKVTDLPDGAFRWTTRYTAKITVKNIGSADARGSAKAGGFTDSQGATVYIISSLKPVHPCWYRLTDNSYVPDKYQALIGSYTIPTLGPGQSIEITPEFNLHAGLKQGPFYFNVIVDSECYVLESNETNNAWSIKKEFMPY